MNCKEHRLPELELSTGQVREALQCILHTILFVRSPGPVAPVDVECESFRISYPTIPGVSQVDDAIESFLLSLTQIGPELLSGGLTVGFFERRASRQLFGLVSHEDRVVWEQWVLRVIVNNTPKAINNDSTSIMERQRMQDTAESMLRTVLAEILDTAAGGSLAHIPPVAYEYEISCSKTADDREHVYSRTNMPPILNLGN